MADWKAFFAMTRHERAGALIVIVLLIIVVCVHVMLMRRGVDSGDAMPAAQQAFEQRCDSINALKSLVKGHNNAGEVRERRETAGRTFHSRKPKETRQGHQGLEPVPGF